MKERKQTKETASAARGQTLHTISSDAAIPTPQRSKSARSLAPSHSSVGANQKRCAGRAAATACK
jgi:hypothetical protein